MKTRFTFVSLPDGRGMPAIFVGPIERDAHYFWLGRGSDGDAS